MSKLGSLFGDINTQHDYNQIYSIFKNLDSDLYNSVANLFVESLKRDYEKLIIFRFFRNYRAGEELESERWLISKIGAFILELSKGFLSLVINTV